MRRWGTVPEMSKKHRTSIFSSAYARRNTSASGVTISAARAKSRKHCRASLSGRAAGHTIAIGRSPDAFRLPSGHVRGSGVVIVRRAMRESSLWQEVTSIPLQAYSLTVGALLAALLLLFNLMLDPSKPESLQPAITDLSKSSGTARTTTGSAQVARSIAPVAPAAQARPELPTTPTLAQSAEEQPGSGGAAEAKPLTRAKPKKSTGQKSTRGKDRADAGYSSYAQQKPAWPTSPAEGTLGPH
jgi:hypothetical protein